MNLVEAPCNDRSGTSVASGNLLAGLYPSQFLQKHFVESGCETLVAGKKWVGCVKGFATVWAAVSSFMEEEENGMLSPGNVSHLLPAIILHFIGPCMAGRAGVKGAGAVDSNRYGGRFFRNHNIFNRRVFIKCM